MGSESAERLRVEGLAVDLGGTRVLEGIDVSVGAGETLAVLGPSGGGKSTMLRAVAGLVPLVSGRILVDGRDRTAEPTHRRGIGLMFQDLALFPHRDVGSNVDFGLRMAGASRDARSTRVAELLALVGLAGFEERPVASLSGGQAQRVALARSLAPSPAVLLLDEPLASLDRPLHDRLVDDLDRAVRSIGQTVVHVTHDHAEALAHADRLAVLARGRILQVGAPEEVWRRPASAEVATVLGQAVVRLEVVGGSLVVPGASASDGVLAPVDWPEGPAEVVVPVEAVAEPVGPDGGVTGRVERAAFEGGGSIVHVVLGEGGAGDRAAVPVVALRRPGPPPSAGERLRVVLRAGVLTRLDGGGHRARDGAR